MKTRAVHTSINEQLFKVVRSGSAKEVKRCLSRADCDPLARNRDECSALMLAALSGNETNVKVLLPHSDPLSKSSDGVSASQIAADNEYHSLAEMIDAYVMAVGEAELLAEHVAIGPKQGPRHRRATLRV